MIGRPDLPYRAGAVLAANAPVPLARWVVAAGATLAAAFADDATTQLIARHQARAGGRTVAGVYRDYARYWYESFRLPGLDPDRVATEFSFSGIEHIHRARAEGNGVILAMPHLGGWEWAAFWMASVIGAPVTAVVERLEDDSVFEWFAGFRSSFGVNVIPLGPDAGTATAAALRQGHVVALLGDRDVADTGVEVEFFGETTKLPAGIISLGLRTGAPVVPTTVYFNGTGHIGEIRPPLDLERQGRFRADVTRLTQVLADEFESMIRVAPSQWHLLNPNWPSDLAHASGAGAVASEASQ